MINVELPGRGEEAIALPLSTHIPGAQHTLHYSNHLILIYVPTPSPISNFRLPRNPREPWACRPGGLKGEDGPSRVKIGTPVHSIEQIGLPLYLSLYCLGSRLIAVSALRPEAMAASLCAGACPSSSSSSSSTSSSAALVGGGGGGGAARFIGVWGATAPKPAACCGLNMFHWLMDSNPPAPLVGA